MATLASLNINNRISRTPLDTSSVPLKSVTVQMKVDQSTTSCPTPDQEAIEFYTLNHLIADLQVKRGEHQELSQDEEKLVKLYFDVINRQSKRMFYYLLAICTRENRHSSGGPDLYEEFGKKKGTALVKFRDKLHKQNSNGAVNHLYNAPPELDLGTYVSFLELLYYKASFPSCNFGGKNWGEVAKVLRKCIYGEMSLELMVDCAYNLSHNNGPIFNKGMWYNNHQNSFIKVLDIQRSGQMPTFLNTQIIYSQTKTMVNILSLGKQTSPDLFGEYVDWYAVEASGSVHKYAGEKQKQEAKYGLTEKIIQKEEQGIQKEKTKLCLGWATFELVEMQRSV